MAKKVGIMIRFFFFWLFLLLFKIGGGLHYSLISPLGERLLPLWIVGLVMSGASILQLVLDIPAGIMLDKFGYKRMLALGTFIFILAASFLFIFTKSFFIVGILFAGLGWLFYGPGRNAYVLSHAEKGKSGKFMAYKDVTGSIGTVIACIALPFIIQKSYTFIASTIVIFLGGAFLAMLLSPKDKKHISSEEHVHHKTHHQRRKAIANFLSTIKSLNPASTLLIMYSFIAAIFYGIVWFVVPLVIAHSVVNANILGIGLGMFDFAVVITGSILYTFIDKSNKKALIFYGLLIFALAGMLLGVNFGLLFLLFAFLTTMGDEIASLPLWAWLHQLDKNHNSDGVISGTINLFEDLGWAIGPLLAGILYTFIGPTYTIIVGAIPILILFVIYQFAIRKKTIRLSIFNAPYKPHKPRHKD